MMPVAETAQRYYRTREVAAIAKVSERQLQFWHEHGVLVPSIVGHTRLYTEAQLLQAERIGRLRKAGVSLLQVRRFVKNPLSWETVKRIDRPTIIGSTLVIPIQRKH